MFVFHKKNTIFAAKINENGKMIQKTDCFLACPDEQITGALVAALEKSTSVSGIYFLQDIPLQSSSFLMHVAEKATADYVLLQLKPVAVTLGAGALERMMAVASDTGAAMVYADRYEVKNGVVEHHAVIDYQEGSLRDDFDLVHCC